MMKEMATQYIEKRDGGRLAVLVDHGTSGNGFAVVMHGWRGFKTQPHVAAMAAGFQSQGITTVRFDARNAGAEGESGGDIEHVTIPGMREDFEDVLLWATTQTWYRAPFFAAGHSAGAHVVARYAAEHPDMVRGVVSASALTSLKSFLANFPDEYVQEWKERGYQMMKSRTQKPAEAKMTWAFTESYADADLVALAPRFTMPVLILVGEDDSVTGPNPQKIWYDALSGDKAMQVIPGAHHTFTRPAELVEVTETIARWLMDL